jgi:lipopolysaccharide/colanic/teichoic acid biosynthesis glycosyltransferase
MLLALTGEAITRPDTLRVNAGQFSRTTARSVARRQALWLLAGFGLFITLTRDTSISRVFLFGFVVLSYPLFYATNRHGHRWLHRFLPSRNLQVRLQTVLLGSREWCDSVQAKLEDYREFFVMQGPLICGADDEPAAVAAKVAGRSPDLLVFAAREFPHEITTQLLSLGDRRGFRCWIPVELSRRQGRRFELQEIGGLQVLTPPTLPLALAHNRATKRAFDIAVSVLVIPPILLPLIAVVAVMQRLWSPGPLFFRQNRIGENGAVFQILKFRTMHTVNDNEARQATPDDDRVYRGARLLRRLSLDEFPQFLNVLRGDMSVVGPRPHLPEHERQFEKFHELYGSRRYVKPGVTGLAQVEGYRGEVRGPRDVRGRARYDLFYVKNWCFGLDLRLTLQTILEVIRPPQRAY